MLEASGTQSGVLVGLDEADDAAVLPLEGPDSLVLTTDFFTPVVDDAFTWGRIAAANACSDVYAMGGRPLWALNLAGWPREVLPLSLLGDVLRGGAETARRAGMVVVGGHTIDDPEPKYGMCVVGRVRTDQVMRMDAARPGDVLVLTKPIGTGVITTAIKREASTAEAESAAVESMVALNDAAAGAMVAAGVRACTDVTGFGLLGHLHRMLSASGVSAEVNAGHVPLLPGAEELARKGMVPGGTLRNLKSLDSSVDWGAADDTTRHLLSDAQTSGGLLAACSPEVVERIVESSGGHLMVVVGRVHDGPAGTIAVTA